MIENPVNERLSAIQNEILVPGSAPTCAARIDTQIAAPITTDHVLDPRKIRSRHSSIAIAAVNPMPPKP